MTSLRSRPWTGDALAILALVVFTLLPRVIYLGADPPVDFQMGFMPDEGAWAHNARQHVLFGRWIMDEHNPGIFATPLYSLALSLLYRLIGIGLVETRLLSALSGFFICVLWYAGLRALLPVRRALPPALVLGLSYFMLSNNRVAFTESFQLLLITASVAAVLHSLRRPAWALVGGCCLVLSLLVKPSAAVMGLVIAAFWLFRYRSDRETKGPLLFIGAAAAVAGILVLALVVPNWEAVSHQLGVSLRNVYSEGVHSDQGRMELFGWRSLGLSMNWFFIQCCVLILTASVFAVARLGRAVDHPVEPQELFCWIWLGVGLLFLANQQYQPDRRFLLLLPPLTYLACSAVQLSGLRIPGRPSLAGRGEWWRVVAIGALAGGVLGFYGQHFLRTPVHRTLSSVFATRPEAGAVIWSLSIVVGVALAFFLRHRLPLRALRVPASVAVGLFLLLDPLRFLYYLAEPRFSIPIANRELADMTRMLPPNAKVIVGTPADAFALETDLFAFTIRIRDWNRSYMNLDGWERFNPSLAVITTEIGREPGDVEQRKVLEEALNRGFVPVQEWPVRYDRAGRPIWLVTLYAEPGLLTTATARR
jgi:4-amino-4-deoxy-L-arabinose transferase-like glycosyltransferase